MDLTDGVGEELQGEAISLEHGLDDAERFEEEGKARWMLLDVLNH